MGRDVTIRCDGCVAFLAQVAVTQGASREEVMEAMGIALYMGADHSLHGGGSEGHRV